MPKLGYHCPGCGERLTIEARVPAAPRSILGTVRCGRCASTSFFYSTRCPTCGEPNFAITTIAISNTELQGVCTSCRSVYMWVTA